MPGLEGLLAQECRGLALRRVAQGDGGVSFEADAVTARRALVELGLAQHILWRVGVFEARHLAELRRKSGQLGWREVLRPGVGRRYVVHSSRSKLFHTEAIRERVEAAVAETLGDRVQPPKAPGEAEVDEVVVHVRVRRDKVTLSIDLAGQPLWRRGYRKHPGRAPLREDLSRAMGCFAGVAAGVRVIDPMFGSGTILIEGAMLEARLAPGRLRGFSMDNTVLAVESAPASSGDSSAASPAFVHIGGDRSAEAAEWAAANARRAGVAERLDLRTVALQDLVLAPFDGQSALLVNPPYGKRLREKDLRGVFRSIGQLYRALPEGSGLAVLAPRPDLLDALGVDCDRIELPHGGSRVLLAVRTP